MLSQTLVTLIVTLLVFVTLCDMILIGPILFVSCQMSPIVAEASTETFYVTVLTLATICDKTQIGLVLFVLLCQR